MASEIAETIGGVLALLGIFLELFAITAGIYALIPDDELPPDLGFDDSDSPVDDEPETEAEIVADLEETIRSAQRTLQFAESEIAAINAGIRSAERTWRSS